MRGAFFTLGDTAGPCVRPLAKDAAAAPASMISLRDNCHPKGLPHPIGLRKSWRACSPWSDAGDLEGLKFAVRCVKTRRTWADGVDTPWTQIIRCPDELDVDPESLPFALSQLGRFPTAWRSHVARRYSALLKISGHGIGNLWLRGLAARAAQAPLPLSSDEDGIRAKARRLSRALAGADADECLAALARLGVSPPAAYTAEGIIARCRDEQWWRRRLRKALGRVTEDVGRELGLVRKGVALYVTDLGAQRHRQQQAQNQASLQGMIAINEDGEEYDLDELIAASTANPTNRRAELMVRMAGFQDIADELGHVGDFWTITAPSRFHPILSQSGERNPNSDGSTAREAQRYLNGVWRRIRAALWRSGIRPYGFRVAEPHHDGTPHWHILVFLPAEQLEPARGIVRHYSLEEDPSEPGAQEHRCTFTRIDRTRGTATGYIAKYIAKNIDGFGLSANDPAAPAELHDEVPETIAQRVRAWASIHGIRQFQQIGGPPVGVWREARRLHGAQTPEIADICRAADAGDWAAYIRAMGGPLAQRANHPVRVARLEWWMTATGELDCNRYGELAALRIYGLEVAGEMVQTRQRWEIRRACSEGEIAQAERPEIALSFPFSSPPWSSVNNCTCTQCTHASKGISANCLRQIETPAPDVDHQIREPDPDILEVGEMTNLTRTSIALTHQPPL